MSVTWGSIHDADLHAASVRAAKLIYSRAWELSNLSGERALIIMATIIHDEFKKLEKWKPGKH